MTARRKDSLTPVTTTLCGFVISCLLASCSGGGSTSALPSASVDGGNGTSGHFSHPSPSPSIVANSSPSPAPSSKVPAPTPTPILAAAAAASDHVQSLAYYAEDGVNTHVPASYMAAHVDIVEGEDDPTFPASRAFKAAGGKMALAYTDPTYVPYCSSPFMPPNAGNCAGPTGNLVATGDETAWVHDASGARINRFVSTYFQYQEMLNVGSPSAVRAYTQMVSNLAYPQLDGLFADDSGSLLSSVYYGFDATGVEFQNDAQWIAGETAQLKATGMKVLYNGGLVTGGPAYNGAFLNLPFVIGQNEENCHNDGTKLRTDAVYGYFTNDTNGLLAIQAMGKLAVCMPGALVDPASRLYDYAAFMLTYSPAYSVFGQVYNLSDGVAVYPETQLVPLSPLQSATTAVSALLNGGVYVREFAACAIASAPIGSCAALVNASGSSKAIPNLEQSYAHSIVLDPQSLYGGGRAHVAAGTPSTLAAGSAAILVQ